MAKGSQLAQLKASLSQTKDGSGSGKKRKRGGEASGKKEQSVNPFDLKVTKPKHDVGGRKIKGQVGKPTLRNQTGIEQRKKTLLPEIERRNKAGGIVDRRFGENDPSLSIEERMLERFTWERRRTSKNSLFNLEDDTELTHYGQSLANLDDFDTIPLDTDSEETDNENPRKGQVDARTVRSQHFGGFDDDEEEEDPNANEPLRKKSKAEVMSEVIAKSKEHKLQRQVENEREEQIRHELDADFKSIQSLLLQPTSEPSASTSAHIVPPTAEKSYDQIVHELAFDARSKPKDRTKTEEELALEQKEDLERAERRRLRRMHGEDDFDSDLEEGSRKWKRKAKKSQEEGDGEEEEEEEEEEGSDSQWPGLGEGLAGAMSEAGDEEASEDDEDSDVPSYENEVEDGSEDDDDNSSTGDGETGFKMGRRGAVLPQSKSSLRSFESSNARAPGELPFTFPCPESHDEWLKTIKGVEATQIPTVVHRIMALHHPSLSAENPAKLQTFLEVLIDHLIYATAPPRPDFALADAIFPSILKLSRQYPTHSANAFKLKLQMMENNLQHGIASGSHHTDSKTFPGTSELALLRTIGTIWSTSDLRHPVGAPAQLLMGSYLELARVRSLKDLASGLFLVTLFSQYESFSKRFVPEALNFLLNALLLLSPSKPPAKSSLPSFLFAPHLEGSWGEELSLEATNILAPQQPNLTSYFSDSVNDPEQGKVDLLAISFKLVNTLGNLYQSLDASVELLGGMLDVVKSVDLQRCSSELQELQAGCEATLEKHLRILRLARRPLLLQSHKPIPIATYAPKFSSSNSSYLRAHDPDRERAAATKLRREYKQERKGALRELRKDAQFLSRQQQQRQQEKDEEYNRSMRKAHGSIEVERAEEKKMIKHKMRDKKRAGRK